MRLDPKFFASYGNLGEVLIALNRLDEAKEILHLADARQINVTAVRRVSYLLAFVRGDSAEMTRQFNLATAVPESNPFAWQARTSVFAGRLNTAHEQFRRAIQMARDLGLDESAAQMITEDAEYQAIVGRCGEARPQVTASLALSRDNFTLQRASRTLALCGAANEALELSDELRRRFPDATLTLRVTIPVIAAVIALQRGEVERTRELLEPVRPYDRTQIADFWPSYLRGLADLQSKRGKEASVEFQYVLDQRGVRPMSPLFALAHLGLARADAMTGETAKAGKAYEDFLALWSDADPGLQVLKDAREEYARVQ
jgi:tetratricopeptide (TPR) repeat protein